MKNVQTIDFNPPLSPNGLKSVEELVVEAKIEEERALRESREKPCTLGHIGCERVF